MLDEEKRKRLDIINSNLLLARGRYWASLRAALQPVFHTTALRSYSTIMRAQVDRLVKELDPIAGTGEIVDVHDLIGRMTLATISETVFGVSIDTSRPLSDEPGSLPESVFAALQIMFRDQLILPLRTTAGRIFLCLPRGARDFLVTLMLKHVSGEGDTKH